MDKMADVLGRAGAWCGQNKYLSAIKNALHHKTPIAPALVKGMKFWNAFLIADKYLF